MTAVSDDILIPLVISFVLGSLIGLERQYRQHAAGLRTNVLVAVGSALFVNMTLIGWHTYGGNQTPVHAIGAVITGVGFLGAGVIMREGVNVRGINTAATLWTSAAVGAAAGASLYYEAVIGTLIILLTNTLLRPIANFINRIPTDSSHTEATFRITLTGRKPDAHEILTALSTALRQRNLPWRDLQTKSLGEDVQVDVLLIPSSIATEELDGLVAQLFSMDVVQNAYWAPSYGR